MFSRIALAFLAIATSMTMAGAAVADIAVEPLLDAPITANYDEGINLDGDVYNWYSSITIGLAPTDAMSRTGRWRG